jgi:Mrp family chromosome partitioning ATPase
MEHVKNAKTLVDAPGSMKVPPIVSFEPDRYTQYKNSAKAAWKRLNEVKLDPVVLSRNMLIASEPGDAATPFDILRTRILAKMQKHGQKRLAITSPVSGCGQTTMIGNLALSLARKADIKTIVFDFNFRRPSLIRKFGLEEVGPRFSALSGTRRNFESTCLRVGNNLGLSLNNTKPANPSELLSAARTRDLIDQVEMDFQPDIMLFDFAPLLPYDDARSALTLVDRVMLMARADTTKQGELDQAQIICAEHGKEAHIVLNKCRFKAQPIVEPRPVIWKSRRAAVQAALKSS